MKDLRCLFGLHKLSDWIEVGRHLERECPRCGKIEAKYPDTIVMLANIATDLLWKYYFWQTQPKKLIPPNQSAFKRSDDR